MGARSRRNRENSKRLVINAQTFGWNPSRSAAATVVLPRRAIQPRPDHQRWIRCPGLAGVPRYQCGRHEVEAGSVRCARRVLDLFEDPTVQRRETHRLHERLLAPHTAIITVKAPMGSCAHGEPVLKPGSQGNTKKSQPLAKPGVVYGAGNETRTHNLQHGKLAKGHLQVIVKQRLRIHHLMAQWLAEVDNCGHSRTPPDLSAASAASTARASEPLCLLSPLPIHALCV
jgi:hypothetical protein